MSPATLRPRLDLRGRTRYLLGGEGGRISSYDEAWDISPSAALFQLITPHKLKRKVVLRDAPPFVVLPGVACDSYSCQVWLVRREPCGP